MTINITYAEIEEVLRAKGHEAALRKAGERTVGVGYTLKVKVPLLGERKFRLSAIVTVEAIEGLDVRAAYTFGAVADLAVAAAKALLGKLVEAYGYISWGASDNQVIVHLDRIAHNAGVQNLDRLVGDIALDVREEGLMLSAAVDFAELLKNKGANE